MKELGIQEVVKMTGNSAAAIYSAVKKNRLICKKNENGTYTFTAKDVRHYMKNKYDRSNVKFEGKLKFDKELGEYSPLQAAEYLGVQKNLIYFLMRTGKMKFTKKGCSYVLHIDEIDRIKKNYVDV